MGIFSPVLHVRRKIQEANMCCKLHSQQAVQLELGTGLTSLAPALEDDISAVWVTVELQFLVTVLWYCGFCYRSVCCTGVWELV